MPASYKIIGTFQEDGIGRFSFTVDGTEPGAQITAEYQNGPISFPIAVYSTSVGLPASCDKPLYVVSYPLVGEHDDRLVRIFSNGARLVPVPSVPKSSYAHRVIRHFTHESQPSVVPDLAAHHANEQARIELLGLFPLDDNEMVARARVIIPEKLAGGDWHCMLTRLSPIDVTIRTTVLADTTHASGERHIIVSCKMPRKLASSLLTVSNSQAEVLPAFYGLSKHLQKSLLVKFYQLTTDAKSDPNYPAWFAMHRATPLQLDAQRSASFTDAPLISIIIPVFEPPIDFFDACIQSIIAQTYRNWELVLVNASPYDDLASAYLEKLDDPRIRIVELAENRGIAGNTNYGVGKTKGDYIAFVDQDDMLEPNTLFEYARSIETDPQVDLLYCDEDGFEGDLSNVFEPMFKPDFNEDVLQGHNYVVHMLMVSRRALDQVELSPDYLSGAQDYDLTLKIAYTAHSIAHIPHVLYHWRHHAKSTSGGVGIKPYANEAGRRAVEDFIKREGYEGSAEFGGSPAVYRTVFNVPADKPSICTIPCDGDKIDHTILAQTDTDYLLFLDSSVKAIDETALDTMLGYFQRKNVGVVGSLIFDEDGPIYHAGLALMTDGNIARMNRYHTLDTNRGYLGSTECAREYSAVTRECMLVKRDLFEKVGGFDQDLHGDYASFDFCWKIRQAGFQVVYTPYARFTHSLRDEQPDITRDAREQSILRLRYPELFAQGDPSINPNCSRNSAYFALGW